MLKGTDLCVETDRHLFKNNLLPSLISIIIIIIIICKPFQAWYDHFHGATLCSVFRLGSWWKSWKQQTSGFLLMLQRKSVPKRTLPLVNRVMLVVSNKTNKWTIPEVYYVYSCLLLKALVQSLAQLLQIRDTHWNCLSLLCLCSKITEGKFLIESQGDFCLHCM